MSLSKPALGSGFTRFDLAVALALLLTAGFMLSVTRRLPGVVGWFVDDGVYLVTAKALADGQGYRHLELPGEPYQTKYPILFPLLLAGVWRSWPDFPANIPVFQVLNTALWTLGSWIAYRLMHRTWALPWWLPAIGVVLAFANSTTLELLRTPLSEPLYLVLSSAALALTCAADPAEQRYSARRLMALALVSGVCAAAAYLTRSVGVCLLVAVPLGWAANRRWKCAALAALGPVLAVAGWQGWCAYATRLNAANAACAAMSYDLAYTSFFPSLNILSRVIYHNVSDLALAMFDLFVPWWREDDLKGMLARGFEAAWPLYVGAVATTALTLVGFVATWKRARASIHFYLLFYAALVLGWPFAPVRFVAAVLPLVTTLQLLGLYVFGLWLSDLMTRPVKPSPAERWSAARSGAGLALRLVLVPAFLLGYVRLQPLAGFGREFKPRVGVEQREREPLVDLLCARTPRDAVISANGGGYLYLRTGRKFVLPLPHDDLSAVFYPADRKFLHCGRVTTPGMLTADLALTRARFDRYVRSTGMTFLVPIEERDTSYWAVFSQLRQAEPGRFRLVGQTPIYELYQVAQSPP